MIGWAVQTWMPIESIGKLSLPKHRIRYRDGFVRVGQDKERKHYVMTLEDKEGRLLPAQSRIDALTLGRRMGFAVMIRLLEFNKQYAAGIDPSK